MQMPRAPGPAGWTVVTPHPRAAGTAIAAPPASAPPQYHHHQPTHTQDFALRSPYPSAASSADDAERERRRFASPAPSFASANGRARSPGAPPTAFRSPRPGLSLDTRALGVRPPPPPPPPTQRAQSPAGSDIRLAPIRDAGSASPYALPPISTLAGGPPRGACGARDAAAVLRRLRMDDDGAYPAEDPQWARRHSLASSCVFPPRLLT